jgi:citrate lyase subunit beta/citryl-CoA lyase
MFTDFRDEDGLQREAEAAAREGFTGKLAIHPGQVAIINAAFTPSAADIAHAREVIAAFAAQPESGVVSVAGKMVDRPHLTQAQRILARAG